MAVYWADQNYKPKIDNFVNSMDDVVFLSGKEFISAPISKVLNMTNLPREKQIDLDCFCLKPKKCYHLDKYNGVKLHICRYLNYFEKYYDTEKELLVLYARMKAFMDIADVSQYSEEAFLFDLQRYILSDSIKQKVYAMGNDCFELQLKTYPSQNMALCYEEPHVRFLMEITVFSNMMIPLIMHYVYRRKIIDVDGFTSMCFQLILDTRPEIDIHAKIQETVFTNVSRISKNDQILWDKNAIRGIDTIINTMYTIDNIFLNVMPKYNFNNNPINMNIATIKNDIRYKVVDVPYEYDTRSLNSSNREGEDNVSPYDKFESQCVRIDEALMLQNQVNAEYTMKYLVETFGGVSKEEINFYIKELTANGKKMPQDQFQRMLVMNFFAKYFGDTASIREITAKDYITLMIMGKRILKQHGLLIFPEIFAGFVDRISSRTSINKTELAELEQMEEYKAVQLKYSDQKTRNYVIEIIATTLTSDFNIIDYQNKELNGRKIIINSAITRMVMREICLFVLMI